jgi:hypothetical protein
MKRLLRAGAVSFRTTGGVGEDALAAGLLQRILLGCELPGSFLCAPFVL